MLLSRVAESVYWAGRYLERAEATARLVHVHTELFLDLPKAAGVNWAPLLAVTGSGQSFHDLHTRASEEEVVEFLATGSENQGSIVSSIARAHANLRVTQAILPSEAWGCCTGSICGRGDTRNRAVDRRTRLGWMDQLIRQCQLFSGLLEGTMSHDETYSFLVIGRDLERADMTTRVLDIQAGMLIARSDGANPYADLMWMGVLRSLGALQMFRRVAGPMVSGPATLQFSPPRPAVPPLGRALPRRDLPCPARVVPARRTDGGQRRGATAARASRLRHPRRGQGLCGRAARVRRRPAAGPRQAA